VTQLTRPSVCDYGGERVAETPPNVHVERSCVTKYRSDTSSRLYDGGGERIPETPPNQDDRPKRYYSILVDKIKKQSDKGRKDKLKLCTAATQSPDSVATEPTTQKNVVMTVGDPIARERIQLGIDGRKSWKACQYIQLWPLKYF